MKRSFKNVFVKVSASLLAVLALSFTACKETDDSASDEKEDDLVLPSLFFNRDGDTYTYTFGEKTYEASTNEFAYDSEGNIYFLNLEKGESNTYLASIKSSKEGFKTESLGQDFYHSTHMAIDAKDDALYLVDSYYDQTKMLRVRAFKNLISSSGVNVEPAETEVGIAGMGVTDFSVYDNVLYCLGTDFTLEDENVVIIKLDLKKTAPAIETVSTMKYENLRTLVPENIRGVPEFKDIAFQNNALYILMSIVSPENDVIVSCGSVLKYDLETGKFETAGMIEKPLDLTGKYLYAYVWDSLDGSDVSGFLSLYDAASDSESRHKVMVKADEYKVHFGFEGYNYTISTLNVYAPEAEESKSFFGPEKFLAVTPKKLVIADDGLAFYTDVNSALCYKNMNRVVTVDLESFVVSECSVTENEFNNEYTEQYYGMYCGSGYAPEYTELYAADSDKNPIEKEFISAGSYFESTLYYTSFDDSEKTLKVSEDDDYCEVYAAIVREDEPKN